MRFPPRVWLGLALLVWAGDGARGQEPRPQRVGELSLVLPEAWQVQEVKSSAAVGVVFTAHGPGGAQLAISRLPVTAAPAPLSAAQLDPMTAPETAMQRIFLEEAGLTPVAGAAASAQEGGAAVMTVDFECQGVGPVKLLVLTCTWSTAHEVLRARLQHAATGPAEQMAELEAIRGSLRFAGHATAGFGEFRLTKASPPPNAEAWARLAPPGKPPGTSTTVLTKAGTPRPMGRTDIGRLVHDYRAALIIIEGGGGSGSGFICKMEDRLFFVTNQHVASEMPVLHLSSLDRTPVPIGPGEAAMGHDIIRFTSTSTAPPLVASTNVDMDAKIGDPIVVLGNSEGARVVQPLSGKLVGIGPDRIEVTAEFVPGNSGSPIIHLPSGKVIGIATYVTKRRFAELTSAGDDQVRRFGYRLDTVKSWQPVAWAAYRAEAVAYDQVQTLTKDLARLIGELEGSQRVQPAEFANSPIYRPIRDFDDAMHKKSMSQADRVAAMQNFMASIRASTQGDIIRSRQSFRYDYFRRRLGEEASIREQMYKLFDGLTRQR